MTDDALHYFVGLVIVFGILWCVVRVHHTFSLRKIDALITYARQVHPYLF